MNTSIQKSVTCVVVTGTLISFAGVNATAQPVNPINPMILSHPQTQAIKVNKKAVFTVDAGSPLPQPNLPVKYQWERQGPWATNYVAIPGATNKTYTIDHVSTNNVAYYRVRVSSLNGTTNSEPAQLLVWTKHSPLTVYGSPVP